MSEFDNPLEGLLPKELLTRIWNDEGLNDEQKKAVVLGLVERTYKAISMHIHEDRGFQGDPELMSAVSTAKSDIDEASLTGFVKWYLGENAEAAIYARKLAENRRKLLEMRATGLERLLTAVDPTALVDAERFEVVTTLSASTEGLFNAEFLLFRPNPDSWSLFDVIELTPDASPEEREFLAMTGAVPYYKDGGWSIDVPRYDPTIENLTSNKFKTPLKERAAKEQVRLAGCISRSEYKEFAAQIQSDHTTASLAQIGKGQVLARNRHVWHAPSDAWWLPLLRPSLQLGEHLVLASPGGGGVSLAGTALALVTFDSHPESPDA